MTLKLFNDQQPAQPPKKQMSFLEDTIQSISFSQEEILNSIIQLHAPAGIELDATYGAGMFYKNIPEPKYKFDKEPKVEGVERCDCRSLPLASGSITSAMFDPPFIVTDHKESGHSQLHKRYSSFKTVTELREMYKSALKEYHRILKPGGILIVKCQDMTHGKKNYFIHNEVFNWCDQIGFMSLDLFILLAKNRFLGRVETQRTARKFHSYFMVFKKRKRTAKSEAQEQGPKPVKIEIDTTPDPPLNKRSCSSCGCTDSDGCYHPRHGSCWWVAPDLCSHCKKWPGEGIRYSKLISSPHHAPLQYLNS